MTLNAFTQGKAGQVALITSGLLLGIICVVHLLVMGSYVLQVPVSPMIFPGAVLLVAAGWLIWTKQRVIVWLAVAAALLITCFALGISCFCFDFSWDGQWYQQAAVYDLASCWNPLLKPMETPDHVNHTSILHFPKSAWYFGAALLRLSGNVETGKAYNLMVLFAAAGVVYVFCRDMSLSARKSLLVTVLVILNPVVWSELTTYLNDGDLYLLLVTYLSATILWLRRRRPGDLLLVFFSVSCLVNTKFTGLVFFLVTAGFVLIYVLFRQRESLFRFVGAYRITGLVAVCLFGFNPYVTNLLNRGHPLYPLMGTKAYPSVFAGGTDDNETYETPQNMRGKSLPVRLYYATFGRPGNAPYNGEAAAKPVNPFNIDYKYWTAYHYHETRVSGFGPYFGLLLALSLAGWLLTCKQYRFAAFLAFAGLLCCMCLSKHFWWPRFFPILWLFPVLPLLLNGATPHSLIRKRYDIVLAVGMIINGLIVAVVHLQWETASSLALRQELQQLHDSRKSIIIDYGYFGQSVEEKLRRRQIPFTPGSLPGPDSLKHALPSVVEGYPNQVMYQFW